MTQDKNLDLGVNADGSTYETTSYAFDVDRQPKRISNPGPSEYDEGSGHLVTGGELPPRWGVSKEQLGWRAHDAKGESIRDFWPTRKEAVDSAWRSFGSTHEEWNTSQAAYALLLAVGCENASSITPSQFADLILQANDGLRAHAEKAETNLRHEEGNVEGLESAIYAIHSALGTEPDVDPCVSIVELRANLERAENGVARLRVSMEKNQDVHYRREEMALGKGTEFACLDLVRSVARETYAEFGMTVYDSGSGAGPFYIQVKARTEDAFSGYHSTLDKAAAACVRQLRGLDPEEEEEEDTT